MNTERRAAPRPSPERRWLDEFRLVIPSELRSGWLALQASADKIRLAPIPDGWMTLSDEELAALVAHAGRAASES